MFFLSDQDVTDALEIALRSFQEGGGVETDGENEIEGGNECGDDDDNDDDDIESDTDHED